MSGRRQHSPPAIAIAKVAFFRFRCMICSHLLSEHAKDGKVAPQQQGMVLALKPSLRGHVGSLLL
jgi:hypothetical protein